MNINSKYGLDIINRVTHIIENTTSLCGLAGGKGFGSLSNASENFFLSKCSSCQAVYKEFINSITEGKHDEPLLKDLKGFLEIWGDDVSESQLEEAFNFVPIHYLKVLMKNFANENKSVHKICKKEKVKSNIVALAMKETLKYLDMKTPELVCRTNLAKSEISEYKAGTRSISLDRALELSIKLNANIYFLQRLQEAIKGRIEILTNKKFTVT